MPDNFFIFGDPEALEAVIFGNCQRVYGASPEFGANGDKIRAAIRLLVRSGPVLSEVGVLFPPLSPYLVAISGILSLVSQFQDQLPTKTTPGQRPAAVPGPPASPGDPNLLP